eukprot:tig00020904_g15287.t1
MWSSAILAPPPPAPKSRSEYRRPGPSFFSRRSQLTPSWMMKAAAVPPANSESRGDAESRNSSDALRARLNMLRRNHLERAWMESSEPRRCAACEGSGMIECRWCHGSGALSLGDRMVCSITGGSRCTICKGNGEERCQTCHGAGAVAGWL